MVQKSILSFFGGGQKKNNSKVGSSDTEKHKPAVKDISDTEDSPIKIKKKARIIESESEDEGVLSGNGDCDKENKIVEAASKTLERTKDVIVESPVKKNSEITQNFPSVSAVKSPSKSPSSSSRSNEDVNCSDIPPLRKTARKQFKRKSSDSTEEKQIHKIKKMKLEIERVDNGKENESISKENSRPKKLNEESPVKVSSPKSVKLLPKEKVTSKSKLSLFKYTPKAKTTQPKIGDMFGRKNVEKLSEEKMETDSISADVGKISPLKDSSPKKSEKGDIPSVKSENKITPDKPLGSSPKGEKDSSGKISKAEFKSPKSVKSSPISLKSPKVSKSPKESPKSSKKRPNKKSPNKALKTSPQNKNSKESPKNAKESSKNNEELSKNKQTPESKKDEKSKELGLKVEEELNKSLNDSQTSIEEPKVATPKLKNPFAKQPPTVACTYDPSKRKYHPIDDAMWKKGQRVPYMALAKSFAIIEDTSGRLKTIEMLSNFLRSVIVLTPDDLLPCVYLCLNKVAPAFEGVELNVGDSFLMKAIAQSTGRSMDRLKKDRDEYGDLGIVAEQSKSNQKMMFQPAPLTIKKVFDTLKEIGHMSGISVQSKKVDRIKGMFVACKESEARFLIRSLSGKLRIGLAEQSVLQAIGQACFLTPPGKDIMNAGSGLSAESLKAKIDEYSLVLKTTYCECPSYDRIISALLDHGILALPEHCKLEPGIPLQPMLAHPTKGVDEILRRFENAKFTCEYKYDGERAQIHLMDSGKMKIFSRNQEDNTSKYPDVLNRIKESIGKDVTSFVMDSEAVAFDVKEKKILPFQILSTRKRKDAVEEDIKVQVCIFPFDLLYLNGKNLVRETFEVRRNLLRENFKEVEGHLQFATSMDGTDTEEIQEFLDESIKGNCEGLMVKTLDIEATYEISKRSRNWLKLKKDYLDGVGDTIDVVPIGGYMGKGKRVGSYGGFLLACYDPENEEYQSLCKIGTGFSEESLKEYTEFFKESIIEAPKSYYRCDPSLSPDHWFDADKVKVWEIKCADLSISPVYKAANGLVDPEKGISLRFPRFLRIRDDKTTEQATSAQQIADLYNSQDQIKNQNASKSKDDDDY